jgi:hypothetical protein
MNPRILKRAGIKQRQRRLFKKNMSMTIDLSSAQVEALYEFFVGYLSLNGRAPGEFADKLKYLPRSKQMRHSASIYKFFFALQRQALS